jgi:molybdenum cofactor biosynthesis protein B
VPVEEHRRLSEHLEVTLCLLVTSDKVLQGLTNDRVTPLVASILPEYGIKLGETTVTPNRPADIERALRTLLARCDVVLATGGTGLGARDVTVDVLRPMCSKDIPGFGELFRYLTYLRYGTAALATRATACAVGDRLVFAVPGSPEAVETALTKLILPEVRHLIAELRGLRH